jgi:hypothetical protein
MRDFIRIGYGSTHGKDTFTQSVLHDKRKHYPLLESTLAPAIYHRKAVAAQQNPSKLRYRWIPGRREHIEFHLLYTLVVSGIVSRAETKQSRLMLL